MSLLARVRQSLPGERYFGVAVLVFIASYLLLPTSKMVNNVFYGMIALPALLVLLLDARQRVMPGRALLGWVLLLAWWLGMALKAGDGQSVKHVLYVALFLLAVSQLIAPQWLRQRAVIRALFWGVGLYVLLSALWYWVSGRYAVGERILWLPGRMTGPIFTSMWLVCCLALITPQWWQERRLWEMLIGHLLVLFCIAYVLQSRSGLVGLVLLWMLLLGAAFLRCRQGRALLISGLVLLGGTIAWSITQVPELISLWQRADAGRLEIWSKLLVEWQACGVWSGCGIDYTTASTYMEGTSIQHPHNIYLSLGLYAGLPALLLFMVLLLTALHTAWQQRDAWGLYLLMAATMLNFDGSRLVGNPDELWLLMLLPMALLMRGAAGTLR